MKIGILTFHSQLNYGGVLQCWALQQTLTKLGHEVVVIDRWWDKDNQRLLGDFWHRSFLGKIKYIIRSLIARNGELGVFVRRLQTIYYVRTKLHLTSYHFYDWFDAPKKLGVDAVVVGSDQVWRQSRWDDPRPYLISTRNDIRKFAYAASFGMREIPSEYLSVYKNALHKFDAISCREAEGVAICKGLGLSAAHVVDPTLLLESQSYLRKMPVERNVLLCYLLSVDPECFLDKLDVFAQKMRIQVKVLAIESLRLSTRQFANVKFVSYAGPNQFLNMMASARFVLTDSFHGLMFSALFNRNVRIIRPSDVNRAGMFARVTEFAETVVSGHAIVDTLGEGLFSFEKGDVVSFRTDEIQKMRDLSIMWMRENIH